MKWHLPGVFGVILAISAVPAMGQSADSTVSHPVQKEQIVDKDGDGIPDKNPGRGHGVRRGKDRFIDKDGDGICDGREGGLGLRHRSGRNGSKGGNTGMKGGNR